MNSTGIVVTGKKSFSEGKMSFSGNPDMRDMIRYSLYWDRIDLAHLSFLGPNMDSSSGLKKLRDEGVLRTVPLEISPDDFPADNFGIKLAGYSPTQIVRAERRAQIMLLEMNQRAGGNWALAQTGKGFDLGQDRLHVSDRATLLEISLNNCLPEPREGTTVDQVLQFKRTRIVELRAFRSAMESLCEKINLAEDRDAAVAKARDEVETSLSDLRTVMSESFAIVSMKNFRTFMQGAGLTAVGSLVGPLISTQAHSWLSVTGGVAASMVGGILNSIFKVDSTKLEAVPSDLRPYMYLLSAEKNFDLLFLRILR